MLPHRNGKCIIQTPLELAQGHGDAGMCGTAGCIPAWSQAAGGALAAVARSKRLTKAQNQLLKCKDLKEKLKFSKKNKRNKNLSQDKLQ